jgi:outer membrane protein TolC
MLTLILLAATPIGFDAAVAKSLEVNPALRSAEADRSRALALVEEARAPSLPSLSINATGTQLDGDRVLSGRVISAATQINANVTLAVPLVAANRWGQWKRAAVAADAVGKGSDDVRRQVALSAGRAWLAVLGQQRVEAAARLSVETAAHHLDYAKQRRAAQIGNELDELRADQELALARQQLAVAAGALIRLQEALGVIVGVDDALSAVDEEPALSADDTPHVDQRTDVAAAQARLDSAKVATSWDWADYLPLLTAIVQPGYQNPPTLTIPLTNFQAQLVLSIPLYDGGLRYGQQKERRANQAQAEALLEQTRRQASSEVRGALGQVTEADAALAAARQSATQANRVLKLSEDAFRAGASTNIEVIDAERRARDAATQVALAEDAARQARLELLAAGGAFPKR